MSILKQLNAKKETQNKELFEAISQNDIESVKDLINKGADVNSIHDDTENGIIEHCTCLYYAVKEGYLTLSKILIESGSDVNAPVYIWKNGYINYPIYPLEGVINNWPNAIETTKLLLRNGASISSVEGRNPLMNLGYWHKTKDPEYESALFGCCKALVEAGIMLNYSCFDNYNTPLFLASINGYTNVVNLFLKHGATLDLASSFVLDQHESIDDFLLNKKNTPLNNIGTLLCKAVENNNIHLLNKIINYGINLNLTAYSSSSSYSKMCPLAQAVTYEVVKIMLENGADPNYILDGDKYSHILCSLSYRASKEIFQILIKYGANPNQQYNNDNITALHAVISSDSPYHKTQLLLDAGANIYARDNRGLSVLHYLFRNIFFIDSLLEISRTFDLLLEYKAIPNIKDNEGNTPLHLAALNNYHNSILKKLIKAGCDIHTQNYFGETALDLAMQSTTREYRRNQNNSTIQYLKSLNIKCNNLTKFIFKDISDLLKDIDKIKDIGIKDSLYNTLLHYAIKRASFVIVKKLIHKGVQINCINSYMKTALDLAIEQEKNQLIEYLKIHGAKEAKEIFSYGLIEYYLPKNYGKVVIDYNLGKNNNELIEVSSTNELLKLPGKSLNKLQQNILLEVFDYISSIFSIKFNKTNNVSKANLFIGRINKNKDNGYTIRRHIIGTTIIRSSLIFDFNSDIENYSSNHLFSIFLKSITQILGLIHTPKELSVIVTITDYEKRISYSKFDLLFLSSRYRFNETLLKQQDLLYEHNNNNLIESIKLVIEQHDLKTLISLVDSIDNIDSKDSNGNSLINLTATAGFIKGTEFLYKKGAELDLASALVLGLFNKAEDISKQQDALENYKQLDQLILIATLRENIPLLKALINYGIQIDDDIFLLSIEIQNLEIIKMFISGGANVMAVNQESEGILSIASKLGCSDETIKFLQESINNNKSKIPSNIIDFKTSRIINL